MIVAPAWELPCLPEFVCFCHLGQDITSWCFFPLLWKKMELITLKGGGYLWISCSCLPVSALTFLIPRCRDYRVASMLRFIWSGDQTQSSQQTRKALSQPSPVLSLQEVFLQAVSPLPGVRVRLCSPNHTGAIVASGILLSKKEIIGHLLSQPHYPPSSSWPSGMTIAPGVGQSSLATEPSGHTGLVPVPI